MMKKTRRRYTAEFKAAAVARLDETGETLSSVAQALGVAATQVKTLPGSVNHNSPLWSKTMYRSLRHALHPCNTLPNAETKNRLGEQVLLVWHRDIASGSAASVGSMPFRAGAAADMLRVGPRDLRPEQENGGGIVDPEQD